MEKMNLPPRDIRKIASNHGGRGANPPYTAQIGSSLFAIHVTVEALTCLAQALREH